ncbi:MAG: 1-acyl-sn-glycerol-3-phosphate acyltransferase [Syntrophomonadaceae bacterium]|nr:1-acyl-sn-glycerol-3-phosphate acyltransferase [Syntrophomonadaceae bacterium]
MLYSVLIKLFKVLFWLGRVKVEGRENIPAQGGVILAANHLSFWDPVVIAAVVNRKIHYMAKEELFENIFLASFFSRLNAFPVKRGLPDRKALKKSLVLLEEGKVLGIFPEGTRSKTGELSKPQHGIAMLALKGKAPVVPVACIGTKKIFPWGWFSPVVIIIGKALIYEEFYDAKVTTALLEGISKDIMDRISLLHNN